mgnify:FL=1
MLGACQVDEVLPDQQNIQNQTAGELFYHPFTLELEVDGPDCAVNPLGTDVVSDDPADKDNLPCVGPVDVIGIGAGATNGGPYMARTQFVFDPKSCSCGGAIAIRYENPTYSYEFELYGHGIMESTIMQSTEIRFPLELIRETGPYEHEGEFVGNLFIQRPSVLASGQDGPVTVNAYIMGRWMPPTYPIANE